MMGTIKGTMFLLSPRIVNFFVNKGHFAKSSVRKYLFNVLQRGPQNMIVDKC
jgi:hypothetical protein